MRTPIHAAQGAARSPERRAHAAAICTLALSSPLLLTSCAWSDGPGLDADAEFPAEALAGVTSEGGALRVELRTAPEQPPPRGEIAAALSITDANTAAPQDGCSLTVVPFMPAMGHGTSNELTITPKGDGIYVVTGLSLYMAGRWELRTTISKCADDRAIPAFPVE